IDRDSRPDVLAVLIRQYAAPGADHTFVQLLVSPLALAQEAVDAQRGGEDLRVPALKGGLHALEQAPFRAQSFPYVDAGGFEALGDGVGPLALHRAEVAAGLLENAVEIVGEPDGQQARAFGGLARGVEGAAGELALQDQ